uniref:Uncharacterized protein n=1 Tax=Rhizophora mucronata TaxID=61149 RepID=A0A2P2PI00_RHIMU
MQVFVITSLMGQNLHHKLCFYNSFLSTWN